jgi:predicted molibdopterin-dependent oxidoreductase YjgC
MEELTRSVALVIVGAAAAQGGALIANVVRRRARARAEQIAALRSAVAEWMRHSRAVLRAVEASTAEYPTLPPGINLMIAAVQHSSDEVFLLDPRRVVSDQINEFTSTLTSWEFDLDRAEGIEELALVSAGAGLLREAFSSATLDLPNRLANVGTTSARTVPSSTS